jgi:hypothetical protein
MQSDTDGARFADEAALSRLADLYARSIDRGDPRLLASLYTEESTHDFGGMFSGGLTAFVDFITTTMGRMRTHHFMGNRLYGIDGDVAEGEIYSINTHVIDGPDGLHDYIAGGRYLDRYRRTPDGWRIDHRKRVIDWTHERPHQPGAIGGGFIAGGRLPDDSSADGFDLLARLGPIR